MKKQRTMMRYTAGVVALGLITAACGGDDDTDVADVADSVADDVADVADSMAEEVEDAANEVADEETSDEEMSDEETSDEETSEIDLSADCPSPLVIQTDWFPEAEHGALYEMVGDDYTVDAEQLTVTGPMWASGQTPTGIDIQIRTGGPAIGFNAPRVNAYTDDSITIAYSNMDAQVAAWADLPMISVLAPLEINPQIIMWDGDEYPDVETIADVGEAGMTINVFAGGGFSDYFVATGVWDAANVDPSYDGSPARFIAEGNIAQQGFASSEPYNYENVFEEYGKVPKFQLLHDAGYQAYSQTLAVKPDDIETLRPCLDQVVPIVQQAIVDYAGAPDRANGIIIDAVAAFDSFWTYDEGNADYGVETMNELGLHGNGPDDIVGNMDEARIQKVIDDARTAGLDVPDDLVAADMFTNEFVDESIGFSN